MSYDLWDINSIRNNDSSLSVEKQNKLGKQCATIEKIP